MNGRPRSRELRRALDDIRRELDETRAALEQRGRPQFTDEELLVALTAGTADVAMLDALYDIVGGHIRSGILYWGHWVRYKRLGDGPGVVPWWPVDVAIEITSYRADAPARLVDCLMG